MARLKRKVASSAQGAAIATSRVQGKMDIRREPIYDSAIIAAGALTTLRQSFFLNPQGGLRSDIDTNLTQPGQMPYPQKMLVTSLRLQAFINDARDYNFLVKLFENGWIRFFVGKKDYLTVPCSKVAGKQSIYLQGGITDGTKTKVLTQIGEAHESGYPLLENKSVWIGSGENFGVELVSNNLAFTLNSPVRLRMYLEGQKHVEVR